MSLMIDTRVRRFFWAHPEWWSVVLAAVAWGWILISHATADHEHMHHSSSVSFQSELLSWCVMVVAMMLPLMLEPMRWVAFQSFHDRRHRAMLFFMIGFLVPWVMLGVGGAWLRTFNWSHDPLIVSSMFALAALWVLVPVRQRALVFCHWTVPLAPSGWKADRDCLRYSFWIGISCVATCGFLMLACAFTGHNLIVMLGGAVLGIMERRSFRPPTHRIFAGVLLLGIWFLQPINSVLLP